MPEWTTLKRMIWLLLLRGASAVIRAVTGTSPLALENAVAAAIKSLKQYGKCTQSTTPTPSAPVDIVCNNGALRMLNLANMAESNLDIGYYLDNSGVRTQNLANFYTLGFIPVKSSTTYTMKTSASISYFNVMEYDSAQGFLNRTLWGAPGSPAGNTITFTIRSDTAYIRFGSNMNFKMLTYADIVAVTWMLTEGATAQDYVPYGQLSVVGTPEVLTVSATGAETQTVTDIPDLFAADDYADTQDIISGTLTRKVGVKILDGTENWSFRRYSGFNQAWIILPDSKSSLSMAEVVCSHFESPPGLQNNMMTLGAGYLWAYADNAVDGTWQAWLAAQKAAGTPVIVIYPLQTETTEQTESHALHTVEGDNIVSWTYPGSTKTVEYAGQAPTNKVGTARVGTAKAG